MTIAEVLEELGVDHREGGQHEHVTQGWVGIDCPRCSPGTNYFRLGIKGQASSCWQCGYVPLLAALAEITGRDRGEIGRLLGGVDLPAAAKIRIKGKLKLPAGVHPISNGWNPHAKYLRRRGFDPDQLVKIWDIKAISVAPSLQWRLFIPVHQNGQVVSWTTRSLADSGRRYTSARADQEAVPIKQTLYGEDYVRHAAVVVEGPTDVWQVGPGAVATFGTAYTKAQVARLSKYPVRVVCYDAETAAQIAAQKLCRELMAFPGQTHRVVLDAADPGAATRREIKELRRKFLDGA